jgi:hypothetical protein
MEASAMELFYRRAGQLGWRPIAEAEEGVGR